MRRISICIPFQNNSMLNILFLTEKMVMSIVPLEMYIKDGQHFLTLYQTFLLEKKEMFITNFYRFLL